MQWLSQCRARTAQSAKKLKLNSAIRVQGSDVNKDSSHKAKVKDVDSRHKDKDKDSSRKDKDKDSSHKDKDKDKDFKFVLKNHQGQESRTRTRSF